MALGRAPEPSHDGVRRPRTPLDSRRPFGAASRKRLLLAAAAVALFAGWSLQTASAQTVNVSNISETDNGRYRWRDNDVYANAFTTGGTSTARYTVSSVVLRIDNRAATDTVQIRNASGSNPGTAIGSLTYSSSSGNARTYTASNITLNGGTTYFLTYSQASGGNASVRYTNSDAQTGTSGWSIADGIRYSGDSEATWSDLTPSMLFTVDTTAADIDPITTLNLVSNTSLTASTATNQFSAQAFTTGPAASGYTVAQVKVKFSTVATQTSTTVRIRSASGDRPDMSASGLVATLTRVGTGALTGDVTFTAPAGTTLSRNTTYWLTVHEGVSGGASNRAGIAVNNDNSETGQTGWSIGDRRAGRNSESVTWTLRNNSLLIAVQGFATPAATNPTVSNLPETEATAGGIPQSTTQLYASFTTGGDSSESVTLANATVKVKTLASLVTVGIWSQGTTGCASGVSACPDA